ncbi:MAG: AAA family ATPase [Bacteroidales bacterium]|nr:AAA family ATPase [Bacteroidales bacterium]
MKLKNLKISNFRCFKQFGIDFANDVTVLIGKNGAGKSTLIDAIHKALSFAFISDKNYDGFLLADGIKSLKPENFSEEQDFLLDVETGYPVKEISIGADAEMEHQPLSWSMQASTQTYTLSKAAYAPTAYRFLDIVNERKKLPVFAFYSDTYPYRSKKTVGELITASPTFGYYCWNSYQGMTGYFVDRLAQNLNVINYHRDNIAQLDASIGQAQAAGSNTLEYSGSTITSKQALEERAQDQKAMEECLAENVFVENALRVFTENDEILPFKRFRPGRQNGKIEIEDRNGKRWSVDYLPAGYKRILYMVIDIAFRSYLLNKGKESDGVVIIDEIDLHMHPSLEATVVERLHRTFRNIQFIMTTHSALVISNLDTTEKGGKRNNVVYKLASGWTEPQALPNLKGIDATATMRDFMDAPGRNVRYEELLNRYIDLFSRDKQKEADTVYGMLVREFGDTEQLHRDIEERKEEL